MGKLKTSSWCSMIPRARVGGSVHGPVEDHRGFAEIEGTPCGPHGVFTFLVLFGPTGWDLVSRWRDR